MKNKILSAQIGKKIKASLINNVCPRDIVQLYEAQRRVEINKTPWTISNPCLENDGTGPPSRFAAWRLAREPSFQSG